MLDTHQADIFTIIISILIKILMKFLITLIFLTTIIAEIHLPQESLSQKLYNSYSEYKENSITNRRFKHSDMIQVINTINKKNQFKVDTVGKSLGNRDIFMLSIGKGTTNVLLWSQMHGDESTATMALFDIFNFLTESDEFDSFRKELLKNLKIFFVPMLNPDGAEFFQRRNLLDIDLNRDALRLEFPESKVLKGLRNKLQPKFAFNLHDQNTLYTSGNSFHSATISFLAPAFNYKKEINEVRANTMKVIVNIYNELKKYIPGHIAKYKDDFEPRAFGDNFIKWGTSSVLIESGGWKNDEEKQFIRKLNYIAILTGLNSIANKSYKKADIQDYHDIPFNDNLLFDLLLRNLKIKHNDDFYKVDVGIVREEKITKDHTQNFYSGTIEDWGDLSIFYGYDEIDLEGYELRSSNIYNINLEQLSTINYFNLIKEGYGFIQIDSLHFQREYSSIPLNIVMNGVNVNLEPKYGDFANFTIWKDNKLRYNIINGFIYDIRNDIDLKTNGLIFK